MYVCMYVCIVCVLLAMQFIVIQPMHNIFKTSCKLGHAKVGFENYSYDNLEIYDLRTISLIAVSIFTGAFGDSSDNAKFS